MLFLQDGLQNLTSKEETNFWYVICDEFISIDKLSKNTRNQVRRGLRKCDVRIVDKKVIIEEGYCKLLCSFYKL